MLNSDRLLIGTKRNAYTVTDARAIFGLAFIFAQIFGTIGLLAFDSSVASSLMIQVAFLLTVVIYSEVKGINMNNAAKYKKCNPLFIVLAIVAVPFALMLALPLSELWLEFLALIGFNVKASGDSTSYTLLGAIIYLIVVSCGPMIGEEAVMRGAVAGGYADKKSKLAAVFISAALFTALHGNVLQFINPFVSGVIMALLYFTSDSIFPGMIMHFTNNFLVSIIDFTCSAQVEDFIEDYTFWMILVGAIGVAGVIFAAIKLGKGVRLTEKPAKEQTSLPVSQEERECGLEAVYAGCYYIQSRNDKRAVVLFVIALASCAISFVASLFA